MRRILNVGVKNKPNKINVKVRLYGYKTVNYFLIRCYRTFGGPLFYFFLPFVDNIDVIQEHRKDQDLYPSLA